MTDYMLDAAGGRQRSSESPLPDPPRDRLADFFGPLTQKAIGARQGLATLAGLPMDLATLVSNGGIWVANKAGADLPYIDRPWLGSENIDAALAAPGRFLTGRTDDPEPRNAKERIARRVGQEVGAAAVPAAGVLGTASRVGVQGVKNLSPSARVFVEPAATAPTHFVKKELSTAAAAGSGAGSLGEAVNTAAAQSGPTPDTEYRQLPDTLGSLLGVGLSNVGAKVRHAGKSALGTWSSRMQRAAADEAVRRSIRPRGWLGNEAAAVVDLGDDELKSAVMK